MSEELSQFEQERRHKLRKLRDLNVDPYGGRVEGIEPLATVKARYSPEMGHDGGPDVRVAGRVMLKRDFGKKLSFWTLRDESGDLQVGLDVKRLNETAWQLRDLVDLGDQVVVYGKLGSTNKGETTVWATTLDMAAKALLPPPAKWEGLSDVELRYRQRYVDLWANPEVMKVLKLRMQIVDEVRQFMRARGYLEVETPMMQVLAGGAAAKPFKTHHNALDIPLYLRIAPELYLKRLLVGGFTKVFELNRNFRNEGISPRHNPEFTMLEAYEAFGSWETMADLVEEMICGIAIATFEARKELNPTISDPLSIPRAPSSCRPYDWSRDSYGPHLLDFSKPSHVNLTKPWRRVSMQDLVAEYTGWHIYNGSRPLPESGSELWRVLAVEAPANLRDYSYSAPDHQVKAGRVTFSCGHAKALLEKIVRQSPAEQLVEVYEQLVEPLLIDPTFVTNVPSVVIPLARKSRDNDFFADVYELAINGQEISPGYSELNDPDVQAANFTTQVGDKEEQQKTDEDFLTALRYGMPPAGGMGLGIDRLVMMLTGAESIRDVILFPLMKPHAE